MFDRERQPTRMGDMDPQLFRFYGHQLIDWIASLKLAVTPVFRLIPVALLAGVLLERVGGRSQLASRSEVSPAA